MGSPYAAASAGTGSVPRILTTKDGKADYLLPAVPAGRPSLSKSLVIERFEVEKPTEESHVHVKDVVALFLQPAKLWHRRGSGGATQVYLGVGEAVICTRGEKESLSWQSSLHALCVQISTSVLVEAARLIMKRENTILRPTLQVEDRRLTSLLWVLEAEQARGYPAGLLFLDSVEEAIAIALITSHSAVTSAFVPNRGGLAPSLLRRVLEFMHHSLPEQVGLSDLAAITGLSPSHFSHQFRASMGVSPYRYMRTLRINRSKSLLGDQELSVHEVATAVGFDNQQHFATVFRSVVGISPSAYRRQL